MSATPSGPTASPAVTAVICAALIIGLCLAAFTRWFCCIRRRSTEGNPAAVHPSFFQLQANQSKLQETLPTVEDLNKYLPMVEYKIWKSQQYEQRMSSPQAATEAQKTLSDPNLSALLPQSPTEDPVHLSKLNADVQGQVKISEEVLIKDRHFESSLTPEALESSCQTTQSALSPDWPVGITVSGDACAICLDIMEDEIKVRGLPCNHAFHVNCVDKWLLWRRACCPVCRFACKIPPKVM
ncbi:unnamed protein product [Penicillium salamii]|nr:unnamed protein product [Penicillium salamii]CAG8877202.1 unnamed protein product [Penicillium salamii]